MVLGRPYFCSQPCPCVFGAAAVYALVMDLLDAFYSRVPLVRWECPLLSLLPKLHDAVPLCCCAYAFRLRPRPCLGYSWSPPRCCRCGGTLVAVPAATLPFLAGAAVVPVTPSRCLALCTALAYLRCELARPAR